MVLPEVCYFYSFNLICELKKDRWFFGRNNTGDIFHRTELFENNAHMEFDLVTSDGGFDCSARYWNPLRIHFNLSILVSFCPLI